MTGTESLFPFRPLMVPDVTKCEDLLDTIIDALGYMELGRGDREYNEARKAVAELRAILAVDDA